MLLKLLTRASLKRSDNQEKKNSKFRILHSEKHFCGRKTFGASFWRIKNSIFPTSSLRKRLGLWLKHFDTHDDDKANVYLHSTINVFYLFLKSLSLKKNGLVENLIDMKSLYAWQQLLTGRQQVITFLTRRKETLVLVFFLIWEKIGRFFLFRDWFFNWLRGKLSWQQSLFFCLSFSFSFLFLSHFPCQRAEKPTSTFSLPHHFTPSLSRSLSQISPNFLLSKRLSKLRKAVHKSGLEEEESGALPSKISRWGKSFSRSFFSASTIEICSACYRAITLLSAFKLSIDSFTK